MREHVLREILLKVKENPHYYPPPVSTKIDEIVKIVRRRIIQLALRQKNTLYGGILDDLLSPEYRDGIISAYYYLAHELGFEDRKAINLISRALEMLLDAHKSRSWSSEDIILEYVIEIIDGEDQYSLYPLTILKYASELGLIYWDGEKWNITELGEFLLKLPPLDLVKALLTLEAILSKNTQNCMTIDFMQYLYKLVSSGAEYDMRYHIDLIIRELGLTYSHVYSWLNRLASFGIIQLNRREDILKANPNLINILENAIFHDRNPLYPILKALILRTDPPLALKNTASYLKNFRKDPLLLDSWGEIEEAINAFEHGDYHATLRTLLPVIERVLREIAVREKVAGTNKGLKALIEILRGKRLISERIESLVKALGRDIELHGLEVLEKDRARLYSELALVSLLEIVRDYRRHKLLHKGLKLLADKTDVTYEELIKAYPNDKKNPPRALYQRYKASCNDKKQVCLRNQKAK